MRNPTRRNRNIGTAKQGYGQDNRLCIPSSWRDFQIFFEKLNSPVRFTRTIRGKEIAFLVEGTLDDYRHYCTVDDICHMLEYIPISDLEPLDVIVLRQPTRKQKILSSVWGRLCFYFEAHRCCGLAIILEAQPRDDVLRWPKSLTPDTRKELDRLAEDGHDIRLEKRDVIISSTPESCRYTQLFRTIPHELGHHRQYREIGSDAQYDSIPQSEKEAAAHRYADELATNLRKEQKIPFDRILDSDSLRHDRLKREWFE